MGADASPVRPHGNLNPLRYLDSFIRTHPFIADIIQTALLVAFSLVLFAPTVPSTGNLVSLAMLLPLALRRWRPLLSASLVVIASLIHLAVGPLASFGFVAVPITVYSLAAHAPRWASIGGLAIAIVGGLANGLKASITNATLIGGSAIAALSVGIVAVAWAFGDVVRSRALALKALQDRADRLEVEAAQERDLAAADERNRIAREMHDIVAHSLQVVITQADGARYAAATDPAAATTTLETIATTGRSALAEMRRLLGVLRGPEAAELRPQPELDDLPALLELMRLGGLDLRFSMIGSQRHPLPAGAELAAYRVVQEALTNAGRHGGPHARVQATLEWTAFGLTILVLDDGRGAGASKDTRGAGQGLLGLKERIDLFGGTLAAGPVPGGGFRLFATLPYQEA